MMTGGIAIAIRPTGLKRKLPRYLPRLGAVQTLPCALPPLRLLVSPRHGLVAWRHRGFKISPNTISALSVKQL
jgi:hypothetical protein